MDTRERLEETPDRNGEFPRLSEAQIQALAGRGERRRTQPGEVLFLGRWLSWRATEATRP